MAIVAKKRKAVASSHCHPKNVALAVLVTGCAGVALWQFLSGRPKSADASGAAPFEAAPRKTDVAAAVTRQELPPEPKAAPTETESSVEPKEEPQALAETATPPSEKPRRRAGARVVDKDGNDVFKPRPELKTKTDKFLFAILSRPMGAGRVVLTTYKIEEDFKKALEAPVEILPTDTDEEIAVKQEIEGWKEYLKERTEAGEPLSALLEDLRDQVNLAAEEHAFARRKLYQMVKEGELDEALDYLETVNAKFEKEGVLPLHIPERLFEKGLEKYGSQAQ